MSVQGMALPRFFLKGKNETWIAELYIRRKLKISLKYPVILHPIWACMHIHTHEHRFSFLKCCYGQIFYSGHRLNWRILWGKAWANNAQMPYKYSQWSAGWMLIHSDGKFIPLVALFSCKGKATLLSRLDRHEPSHCRDALKRFIVLKIEWYFISI